MNNTSRCRERLEGRISRRRTYCCIECKNKFQVDTLNPLPQEERLCDFCRHNTSLYMFTDKIRGRDKAIRAPSVELATLRAWDMNPNLTFKMPQ